MRVRLAAGVLVIASVSAAVVTAGNVLADGGPEHRLTYPRPVPLGVSGGSIQDVSRLYCCGGTLGAPVEDASGVLYILSNNHVLARTNKGEPGEDILQPALIDQEVTCAQDVGDRVADLTRFVPITFKKGAANTVDAAVAAIVPGAVDPSGTILDIGTVNPATAPAQIGLAVTKSGRTTGQTFGEIAALDVTADIAYDKQCGLGTQIARFVNQIRIAPGAFSAGGDSGALIVEAVSGGQEPRPVGLLFAGSETSTLANPIDAVLSSLCVAMAGATSFPDPAGCPAGAGGGPPGKGRKNLPRGLEVASEVKARHEERLFGLPGVVGTGLSLGGNGRPVIEVYLEQFLPEAVGQLPRRLEGIEVRAIETGAFRAR